MTSILLQIDFMLLGGVIALIVARKVAMRHAMVVTMETIEDKERGIDYCIQLGRAKRVGPLKSVWFWRVTAHSERGLSEFAIGPMSFELDAETPPPEGLRLAVKLVGGPEKTRDDAYGAALRQLEQIR